MRTVTSAQSPASWESSHPHASFYSQKQSCTPLTYQSRTPASTEPSLPRQSPSLTSCNNLPQPQVPFNRAHRDTKAASPSYFNLVAESTAHCDNDDSQNNTGSDYLSKRRANDLTPSAGGNSPGATRKSYVSPVNQRPEFAAFRKESESSADLQLSWLPTLDSGKANIEGFGSTNRPTTPFEGTGSRPGSAYTTDQSKRLTPEGDRVVRSPKRILGDQSMEDDRPRRNSPAGFIDGEERDRVEAPNTLPLMEKQSLLLSLPQSQSRNSRVTNSTQDARCAEPNIAMPTMVDPQLIADLLTSKPNSILLLDTRVSTQYVLSRVAGALSLCIPTTLLKRPSFDTKKVAEVFKDKNQRLQFERWRSSKYIVVYDARSSQMKDASTCIQTLKKFINEGWKGNSFIIRGGFNAFASKFPSHIVKDAISMSATASSSPKESLSIGSLSSCPSVASAVGGCAMPPTKNAANPFFGNIRQNTDLIDGVGQIKVKLPFSMTKRVEASLPLWLKEATAANDEGYGLSKKFLEIERREQRRMQQALSGEVSYGMTENQRGDPRPIQIAGIEKGTKNRYNNIWPYEHSRVKLERNSVSGCDYVNANHIQSAISKKEYIATQCPVPDSFAVSVPLCSHETEYELFTDNKQDFWSMVWHEDVRVVVMLTAEMEGGQVKAHNYWKSKQYGQINVMLLSETSQRLDSKTLDHRDINGSLNLKKNSENTGFPETKSSSLSSSSSSASSSSLNSLGNDDDPDAPILLVRKFTISRVDEPFARMREITQLQYTNWPDFGALAKPAHLLDMVEKVNSAVNDSGARSQDKSKEKHRSFLSNIQDSVEKDEKGLTKPRPIVVHCSAGCGRTGTFCTVDTVVDALKWQQKQKQNSIYEKDQEERFKGPLERERTPMDIVPSDGFPLLEYKAKDEALMRDNGKKNEINKTDLLKREDTDAIDPIEKTIEDFRKQRLSMVQCLRQYVFCYETILEWFVRESRS